MDANVRAKLEGVGINVDETVSRLMNNEGLFLRVLKKFPADESYQKLLDGVASGEAKATFEGAHGLKGVAANLGMEALLKELHPIVETSRIGSMDGVVEQLPKVTEKYNEVVAVIQSLD